MDLHIVIGAGSSGFLLVGSRAATGVDLWHLGDIRDELVPRSVLATRLFVIRCKQCARPLAVAAGAMINTKIDKRPAGIPKSKPAARFRRDHGMLAHRAAELFSRGLSQFEASWVKKLFDRKLPIG